MTVDGTTSAMSLKRLQSHPSDRQSRGSPYDVMRRPKSSDYVNGLTRRRHTQQHVAGPPKSSSHTLKVQLKTVSLRAGRHRRAVEGKGQCRQRVTVQVRSKSNQ